MKISHTLLSAGATFALASPAFAHDGDHSIGFTSTALHWLSSPTHSLFAVIGGIAVTALIIKIVRKKA